MCGSEEIVKKYGYLNFKTTNEEKWSEYLVEDGMFLRVKTIPHKFFRKDDNYALNATKVVVAFSPLELRGPPSHETITQSMAQAAIDKIDMKFEAREEPWNEYELDNGIKIFLRTVVTSVSSTKLYDNNGEPVYIVQHQALVKKYPL